MISGGCSTIRRCPPSDARELRQRAVARAGAGALDGSVDLRGERAVRRALVDAVDVQPLERAGQQRLVGEAPDLVAVGRAARDRGRLARVLGSAVLPTRHPDARDEPAQVPLPRARVRLVEVVQVDDQVTLRGGVEPEVAQVRVAADHGRDAGRRQRRQVVGHDDGRPAQEPVRRRGHAPDPDRDQPVQAPLVALLDLRDRVAVRRRPLAERRTRHRVAQGPARRVPLLAGRRPPPHRRVVAAVRALQHHVTAR